MNQMNYRTICLIPLISPIRPIPLVPLIPSILPIPLILPIRIRGIGKIGGIRRIGGIGRIGEVRGIRAIGRILPNHSKQHGNLCLFITSTQVGKLQNTRPKIYLPNRHSQIPTVSRSAFHATNLFLFSRHQTPTNSLLHFLHINAHNTHNSPNRSDEGQTLETSAFLLFTVANLRFQLSC